ncbi:MAG: DUF4339 domain-containing protein [Bacteroides sp.]|nr:DUF4339 domain-containing protein [Bacteroides sp.]
MKYFAIIDGEQKGPFELDQLAEAGVKPSTYVWRKGMADWEKAEDDADICRYFRNRLYDLMHPESTAAEKRMKESLEEADNYPDTGTPPAFSTRFDRYIADSGAHIPSLEEIDSMQNKEVPPPNMLPVAIIATLLFFPLTGVIAIYFAIRTKKAWKEGKHKEAHENCRSSKMWTGITFCLGLILYALLARL